MCDDYSVQLWLAAMGLDVSDAELVHKLICWKSCREDLNAKDLVSGIARLQGNARNIDMALFRKDRTTAKLKVKRRNSFIPQKWSRMSSRRRLHDSWCFNPTQVQAWSTDIGRKECGVVGPWLLETLAFNLIAMVSAAIGHTTLSCTVPSQLELRHTSAVHEHRRAEDGIMLFSSLADVAVGKGQADPWGLCGLEAGRK